MNKKLFIPSVIVIADQLIKSIIRAYPDGYEFVSVPGLFRLVNSHNTGAAFSMLSGRTFFLVLASVFLLIAVAAYFFRMIHATEMAYTAALCLIGGGIGNLIDRFLYGGVTDYIELSFVHFPVFNLADIAITCSVGLLMILVCIGKLEKNTGEDNESDC